MQNAHEIFAAINVVPLKIALGEFRRGIKHATKDQISHRNHSKTALGAYDSSHVPEP